jgi:poly [ADP-ribose] polymerase
MKVCSYHTHAKHTFKTHIRRKQQRAVDTFKKKFSDKTLNDWDERDSFESQPNKYTWLARDYGAEQAEVDGLDDEDTDSAVGKKKPVPECTLPPKVKEFVELIGNVKMMEDMMVELGYDAKELPLGKLGKQIYFCNDIFLQ